MRAATNFLVANYGRQKIIAMARAVPRVAIFEEAERLKSRVVCRQEVRGDIACQCRRVPLMLYNRKFKTNFAMATKYG
jgi:hypothetical protein